jgi:hypothetical protein
MRNPFRKKATTAATRPSAGEIQQPTGEKVKAQFDQLAPADKENVAEHVKKYQPAPRRPGHYVKIEEIKP